MRYGRKLSAVTKEEIDLYDVEKLFVEALPIARVEIAELKLTWNYQDVSILLPVIGPMSTGAIADCKTRRLLANLLIFSLVFVQFSYRVLYTLLL